MFKDSLKVQRNGEIVILPKELQTQSYACFLDQLSDVFEEFI